MRMTFLLAAAAAVLLACGGAGGSKSVPASASPAPGASAAATGSITPVSATTVAAATPAGAGSGGVAALRTLGAVKFADRGTASAVGKTELAVAVEDFAFTPTFVQGTPGQKVTLQLTNDTSTTHNLSVKAQQVDRDVPAKSKATVEVTIPQSGVLLFFCKFHTAGGMNGELLSSTAAPAAVEAPAAAPAPSAGAGDVGY